MTVLVNGQVIQVPDSFAGLFHHAANGGPAPDQGFTARQLAFTGPPHFRHRLEDRVVAEYEIIEEPENAK